MIKKSFVLILLLFIWHSLFGQTSSLSGVKSQLNTMFSGLDKTKVPTGYLWDTAVNVVEAEDYNGSALTDSNYVSLPVMGDLLYSINSASVGADTICVQAALSRIERNTSLHNAMVGVLFQPYNYIVANALTDNLISYSNGIVSDVYQNGIWRNPYGETVLFGYATGNDGVVGQNTTFTITNIDSLSTQVFQCVEFDPGDGNGFRSVSLGGSVVVSYPTVGYVETKLRVMVSGLQYLSHSLFFVRSTTVAPQSHVLNHLAEDVSAEYEGQTYSARISFLPSTRFDKRPLIVSEGFDPWRLFNENSFHSYSGATDLFDICNESLFLPYDVIYVDWHDYGADIRANAEVFKEVISWVNDHNKSGEPNIVLGQSMGGLIARYALRTMEIDKESHNTTLFISHDVPYLGANVSPGLLYTYWDLYDIVDNEFADFVFYLFNKTREIVPELKRLGTYTSVRQMLPLYMNSSWQYDSTMFDDLQSELNAIGYPKGDPSRQIENVAIVNGGKSSSGNNAQYVYGDTIIDAQIGISSGAIFELLMLFLFKTSSGSLWPPGKTTLILNHKVYPYLSNGAQIRSSTLTFKKKLLWLDLFDFTIPLKNNDAPMSGICYDACSSSFFSPPKIQPDTLGNFWVGHLFHDIHIVDSLAFIPTFSAMAMPNAYYLDFSNHNPLPEHIPFTSYTYKNTNSAHISLFSGVSDWLDTVTQTEISCQGIALGGDIMTLSGNPHNDTFTWSATDGVSINSTTGQIDSTSYGITTLTATSLTVGRLITKTKKVMVGFPKVALSVTNVADGNYVVKTSVSDREMKDMVQKLVADSLLTYVWGVKEGTSDIVWQSASVNDSLFVVGTPNHDDLVVLLKWKTYDGRESAPVFINVDCPFGFMQNMDYVYKMRHGDMVYEIFPTWLELITTYGHDCFVLFAWGADAVPFEPISITLDSHTYPLTEKRTLQDGQVLFVFDVLYDQTFYDVFYEATLPYNSPSVKSIYVNTSLGVYEELLVFCMPEQLPPQPI